MRRFRRRYSRSESLEIIDALAPRRVRLADVAARLGRTPAAVERHYSRLLAAYGGREAGVEGARRDLTHTGDPT